MIQLLFDTIVILNNESKDSLYPISELALPLCFPHTFSVGGASCTLDPGMGVENDNIKLKNNKFISVAV